MRAQILGSPSQRSPQVGAANVPDEQRIARKHGMGMVRVLVQIKHQDGDGLDGVAWRFQHLQPQPWEAERIPVLHRHKRVFRLGACTEMNGCPTAVTQLQVPGDEVRMEVGQKDVADREAELLSVYQVLLDIPLWVDHDPRSARLVPQQVGGMGQASEVVLFQDHGALQRTSASSTVLLLEITPSIFVSLNNSRTRSLAPAATIRTPLPWQRT